MDLKSIGSKRSSDHSRQDNIKAKCGYQQAEIRRLLEGAAVAERGAATSDSWGIGNVLFAAPPAPSMLTWGSLGGPSLLLLKRPYSIGNWSFMGKWLTARVWMEVCRPIRRIVQVPET